MMKDKLPSTDYRMKFSKEFCYKPRRPRDYYLISKLYCNLIYS